MNLRIPSLNFGPRILNPHTLGYPFPSGGHNLMHSLNDVESGMPVSVLSTAYASFENK